jgi:cysteine synthase A
MAGRVKRLPDVGIRVTPPQTQRRSDRQDAMTRQSCNRNWISETVRKLNADFNRSADTHLIKLDVPGFPDQPLYLKDESIHPSGSLKHRLARSLYLYGICNGAIGPETVIVESSSGSTAVSEAYFAKLLGLRFIAVLPQGTAQKKIDQIEFYGGETRAVPAPDIYSEAERLAADLDGHYMDQFTYAERATDWRGNNNIAESLFQQLELEEHGVPDWVVMSAGTGGTSATIGRYLRYRCDLSGHTRLCVADPENSVFYDHYVSGDPSLRIDGRSRIEGIGRPRVEASFQPHVIDRMMQVPDASSIATIHWLEGMLGRKCGGSTGTNVWAALHLMAEMREAGRSGSVTTLICDGGERYLDTYYNAAWLAREGLDLTMATQVIDTLTKA